jgi:hypothetical protein
VPPAGPVSAVPYRLVPVYFIHSTVAGYATQYSYGLLSLQNRSFFVKLAKGDSGEVLLARVRETVLAWQLKKSMAHKDKHAPVSECGHLLTDPPSPPTEKQVFSVADNTDPNSNPTKLKEALITESNQVSANRVEVNKVPVYFRSTQPRVYDVKNFSDAEQLWTQLDSVLLEVALHLRTSLDQFTSDTDDWIADKEKKEKRAKAAAERTATATEEKDDDLWNRWQRPKEKGLFIKS